MVGLAFLAFIAAYVVLWWFVVQKARNRGEKVAAILIAVLIPFWDLPIGYYNFQAHCREDGGVHYIEKIAPQKSLYFATITAVRPDALLKSGFDAVEFAKPNGAGILRFSSGAGGKIQSEEIQKPSSPLRVSAKFNEEFPWNLFRHEQVLEDRESGRPLARAREYVWLGGWIQRRTAPMLTPAGRCHVSSLNGVVDVALKGTKN